MASTTEAPKPPKPDEFELSLFGPGVGECVVLHLGEGAWIVVDSCRDRATRNPIALDYLDALGVDVASAVKLVVVTHWHDDHIGGAADVLERATSRLSDRWDQAGRKRTWLSPKPGPKK